MTVVRPHQTLRDYLIAEGVIRPGKRYEDANGLTVVHVPEDYPCLRIDRAGRDAAAREQAQPRRPWILFDEMMRGAKWRS